METAELDMTTIKLKSPTRGNVTIKQMVEIVRDYVNAMPLEQYDITIGTDSQNFDRTKIVMVVAVHRRGKGGIFFYKVVYQKKITNIRVKLTKETSLSLALADEFLKEMEEEFYRSGFDYQADNINYAIHVDAGHDGKTNALIPEITAWVEAQGYHVKVKPDSYAASSIANKFSK